MRLDPNPSFRKVIVPWYDSETICVALMALMIFVFLFSLIGISLAADQAAYRPHVWIPTTLLFLSAFVIVSLLLRLIRKFAARFLK